MPAVRGLEGFLRDRKLIKTENISALDGSTVGFESFLWLRLQKSFKAEPFQMAIGGQPLTLERSIDSEIKVLEQVKISPIFVFSGIVPPRNSAHRPPLSSSRARKFIEKRHTAWKAFEDGQNRTAQHLFGQLGGYVSAALQRAVFDHLCTRGVRAIRAPYSAAAQLAFLERAGFVHGVFGGLELLVFGVEKVITKIDYETGTIEWVTLSEVLENLGVSHESFVHICLLSGYDACKTFPVFMAEHPKRGVFFQYALQKVKEVGSAAELMKMYSDDPEISEYKKVFEHSLSLIHAHGVLHPGGRLSSGGDHMLSNGSGATVSLLQNERLYPLLAKGVAAPTLLSNITTGVLMETAPLVDSAEYAACLDDLLPLRAKIIQVLTSALGSPYSEKTIVTMRWFDPENSVPLPKFDSFINSWLPNSSAVSPKVFKKFSESNDLFDLETLLSFCCSEVISTEYFSDPGNVQTVRQALCSCIMQTLQLAGYICRDGGLLDEGKILLKGVQSSCSSDFSEQLLLANEMIRSGRLNGQRLQLMSIDNQVFHAPSFGENDRQIRLLVRLFSLLPIRTKSEAWSGPIDRELSAFNCIVDAFYRTFSHTFENTTLAIFLRGEAAIPHKDLSELVHSLPFRSAPSACMGLIALSYLRGASMETLKTLFPQVLDIHECIEQCSRFLEQVMAMVRLRVALNQDEHDICSQFEEAHKFFLEF
eukprot:164351_1